MNPDAPSFVPSMFLVPSAVLLRGKDSDRILNNRINGRGKASKAKRRHGKKRKIARKGKKKVLDKDYPPLTETYASNKGDRELKAYKKTDVVWPIEQKGTRSTSTSPTSKGQVKKTTRVKVKRSKAKYYGIGEFKLNKPLFSCNSTEEEKVKQTEGSKGHTDDDHKDNVTVKPALTDILEPTFFDDIRMVNNADE